MRWRRWWSRWTQPWWWPWTRRWRRKHYNDLDYDYDNYYDNGCNSSMMIAISEQRWMLASAALIRDIISHALEGDRLVMTAEQDTKSMFYITTREDDHLLGKHDSQRGQNDTRDRGRERERWIYICKGCVVCYHRFQLDKESDSQVSTQNLQDTKAKDTLNWEWSSEPVQISSANFASNFQKTSRSRCKHKLVTDSATLRPDMTRLDRLID